MSPLKTNYITSSDHDCGYVNLAYRARRNSGNGGNDGKIIIIID